MVKNREDEDVEDYEEAEESDAYEEEAEEEEVSEEEESYAPKRKKKSSKSSKKEEAKEAKETKETKSATKEHKSSRKKKTKEAEPAHEEESEEEEKTTTKKRRKRGTDGDEEPKKKHEPASKPVKEKRVTKREANKAKEEAVMKQYAEVEAKAKSFEDVTAHIDSILGNTASLTPYKNLLKKTTGNRELVRKIIAYIFSKSQGHPDLYAWAEEMVLATQQALFAPKKIVHDTMFFPSVTSEAKVVNYLNSATTTLDICVFSISYNLLGDAILAAHTRGVKVRVISDDEQAKNPGADIERLHQGGVPLKIDLDPKAHMHNKFVLADGQLLLTGSFNWTKQAALKNNENFMATNDEDLIRQYQEEFERLWEKFIVPGTEPPPRPPKVTSAPAEAAAEKKPAEESKEGEADPDMMISG